MTTPGKELLFLALGGSGEIGMNANLYGCDGKWIMLDLGVTFGSHDYPGIDIVMPDLEFIEDRKADLLGIVLTHGHEDHIGAIPYLAAELGVPLYANRFTAGLIAHKLAEEGLEKEVEIKVVDIDASFRIGPFGIRLMPLAHSILEMSAAVIDTPYGRVFHTGDWKLDEDPVLGTPSTAAALTAIGDEGVDVLVCDSTNAFNAQASGTEGGVRDGLLEAVGAAKGRVIVTTFASNAARLATLAQQNGLAASSLGSSTRDDLLDFLVATVVGPRLGHRRLSCLHHFPASQAALAQLDADDPRTALRFELYAEGIELANGYVELAGAAEQRAVEGLGLVVGGGLRLDLAGHELLERAAQQRVLGSRREQVEAPPVVAPAHGGRVP